MPDADSEPLKRSIDERMDALAMNLELLYRDRQQDMEQQREFMAQQREHNRHQDLKMEHLTESVNSLRDSVDKLVFVVNSHENRISKLECAS